MKTRIISLLVLVVFCCWYAIGNIAAAQSTDAIFNFDNNEAGKLPADWTPVASTWMIAADGLNKAMKQAGKNEGDRFNICINSKLKYQNLEMEVRIKALEGEEDQGGGLVWRYQDAKNYYITRANPLENNFRVYKVVNGNRKQMESANAKMKTEAWYSIKVVITENKIECYYNGQKLLSHTDDTFPNAGLVGFWSKADAVSLFDDLKIKVLK
ncbi:MAG: DUF1080 domain-containing protein [Bacteroidetes bacterium]|nr:DUF1080 domain-containing protein [Bacteroidota bacterium]